VETPGGSSLSIRFKCPHCKTYGFVEVVRINASHLGLEGWCQRCDYQSVMWYRIHHVESYLRGDLLELPFIAEACGPEAPGVKV